jgi:hypothetical protein
MNIKEGEESTLAPGFSEEDAEMLATTKVKLT